MKNRFRKRLKIKHQITNIIKQYPNLEIIEFDKIFDTNIKIDKNNKIKKLIFFGNKELPIENIDGYHLSNIEIGFDKLLIIGYESEDYIIEKSYTLDIADKEILYWHDIDTITLKNIKDEWINNGIITIPSYNIIKNIQLDNLTGINPLTLDLRNINKIENLKIDNKTNVNSLILNTNQQGMIEFNDCKNFKLIIYDENINYLDNEPLTLFFNKDNDKIIYQINLYGENIYIKYNKQYYNVKYRFNKQYFAKTLKINKTNFEMGINSRFFASYYPVTKNEFNKSIENLVLGYDYNDDFNKDLNLNDSFGVSKKLVKILKNK